MVKKNDIGTFFLDFLTGGASAAVSKTFASPIEVIKLRLQNVEAMLKAGTLDKTYAGIGDVLPELSMTKELKLFGKVTEPTSSDTSPLKP